jgi:DNA invertase Pin-like site-specific DNA recombinase
VTYPVSVTTRTETTGDFIPAALQRAREYLRVSRDKTGRMASPEKQHDENSAHAARNGWALGELYREADAVSASRYTDRARAEYDRLIADLEGGAFGAEILILHESSRGSRRVGEWAALADACEDAGVRIYVTTHGRLYDPSNPRDRRSLMEDATDSEYESGKISLRVSGALAQCAARGEPHGRVPYGYRRVYDPLTRRLIAQELHPHEAPIVVELFERVRAGESIRAIAIDFAARGIKTRGTAKQPPLPFSATVLRDMAASPTYAGLRVHQPQEKGGRRARRGTLAGAVPGTWPPLVDAELFHEVHALVTNPQRHSRRPGGAKHLLSMIAVCGACAGPLTADYRGDRRMYTCRDGSHVRIAADDMDAVAAVILIAWLSEPATAKALAPSEDAAPELRRVRADLAAAGADLADWQERAARREVSAASFAKIEPGIVAAIQQLEETARRLSAPPELADWLGPEEEVAARWKAAGLAARRRVLRAVFSPGMAGTLRLMRCGKGNRLPAARRIRIGED